MMADPRTISSYMERCAFENRLVEPNNLVVKSSVTKPQQPAVSIPYNASPPGHFSFTEFATKLLPYAFNNRTRTSTKRKRSFPANTNSQESRVSANDNRSTSLTYEETDSAWKRSPTKSHFNPNEPEHMQTFAEVVKIREVCNSPMQDNAVNVVGDSDSERTSQIYDEDDDADELRRKIRQLKQRLCIVVDEEMRSTTPADDAEYKPPSSRIQFVTLDKLSTKRRLQLRTVDNRFGAYDIRVELAASNLVVNHNFSNRQVAVALKTIAALLGFDIDVPSYPTITRWLEIIVALTSYDCVNALLSDNGFISMETDGTSMRMSKLMRAKIQATQLNSDSGEAIFPCIVVSAGDGKTIAEQFVEAVTDAATVYCQMQHGLKIKTYENDASLAEGANEIVNVLIGR